MNATPLGVGQGNICHACGQLWHAGHDCDAKKVAEQIQKYEALISELDAEWQKRGGQGDEQ